ncbi:MAG: nuclease-related domain-containing protein [Candidatus Limnocylindrales bacterium]
MDGSTGREPKAAWPTEASDDIRRLRLNYPATCAGCGSALEPGTEAWYRRATHEVWCLGCGPGEPGPEPPVRPDPPAPDPGVAGASAQREYEHRHATREARVKARWGERLGGLVLALTDDPGSTRAWARGAQGEVTLGAVLTQVPGIRVLHDRRVPGTRGNLDHLVIGPAGVFVIDAKHYRGQVHSRDRGGWFRSEPRLYVGHRDCSALADGMGWQQTAVSAALQAAGVAPLPPILPVLCFVGADWPLLRPPERFQGVYLAGTRSIQRRVSAGAALDAATIERLAGILGRAFPPK